MNNTRRVLFIGGVGCFALGFVPPYDLSSLACWVAGMIGVIVAVLK